MLKYVRTPRVCRLLCFPSHLLRPYFRALPVRQSRHQLIRAHHAAVTVRQRQVRQHWTEVCELCFGALRSGERSDPRLGLGSGERSETIDSECAVQIEGRERCVLTEGTPARQRRSEGAGRGRGLARPHRDGASLATERGRAHGPQPAVAHAGFDVEHRFCRPLSD